MDSTLSSVSTDRQLQEARWCRDALAVQNACNPSGVSHSLHQLCCEMHEVGLSTYAICDHPATILFVAKLADLAGLNYMWPRLAEEQAKAVIAECSRPQL